jgi:hypothetical protein
MQVERYICFGNPYLIVVPDSRAWKLCLELPPISRILPLGSGPGPTFWGGGDLRV